MFRCQHAALLFALVALLLGTPIAAAAECVEYQDYYRWLGHYERADSYVDYMDTRGSLIALGCEQELTLLRFDDIHLNTELSILPLTADIRGLFLTDTDALVIGGRDPVRIYAVDTTDPYSPAITDSLDLANTCRCQVLVDDRLYCSTNDSLVVFDASASGLPVRLGALTIDAFESMTVGGDRLYGVGGYENVMIVDVADPAAMSVIGIYGEGETPYYCALKGDRLYTAWESDYGDEMIDVLDVSDPAEPALVASWVVPEDWYEPSPYGMWIFGDYLYIGAEYEDGTGSREGVLIFDVSSPDAIALADRLNLQQPVRFMAEREPGLFDVCAGYDGYWVLQAPEQTFAPITGIFENARDVWDVEVRGDIAYVTDDDATLIAVDISDLTNPVELADVQVGSGTPYGLQLQDDRAWIANFDEGLSVVDITDPANMSVVASFDTYGARDVVVADTLAYVAEDLNGLSIYSVKDIENIYMVGSLDNAGRAMRLKLRDDVVYLADLNGDFVIIDVFDPSAPMELATVALSGTCSDVVLRGDYAYLATNNEGVRVVDVSDPAAPELLQAKCETPGAVRGLGILGNHLYAINDTQGVVIFDLFEPSIPVRVGLLHYPHGDVGAWSPAAIAFTHDDNFCFTYESAGLLIGGIQCDGTPVYMGGFTTLAEPGRVDLQWEMELAGDVAALRLGAETGGRHWPVDHAETAPGLFAATDRSPNLAAGGKVLYTLEACEDGLWRIVHNELVDVPAASPATRLHAAWPNPFNPHTTVSFQLAEAGRAELAVYDITGRRIRTLAAGRLEAGLHEAVWDGRDDAGREVASGVYFARLTGRDAALGRKLILLR